MGAAHLWNGEGLLGHMGRGKCRRCLPKLFLFNHIFYTNVLYTCTHLRPTIGNHHLSLAGLCTNTHISIRTPWRIHSKPSSCHAPTGGMQPEPSTFLSTPLLAYLATKHGELFHFGLFTYTRFILYRICNNRKFCVYTHMQCNVYCPR